MRFMPGENQAENYQKLIDHLTNKVLGEKGMGSKMACLLREEDSTLEDVRVAEHIWGPAIEPHAMKGKGTRKKPIPQSQDIVAVPPEVKRVHKDIHLHMDVMWVNGLPFLTSISANIMFRTATFIEDRKASTLSKHLDAVLHHHNMTAQTLVS